MDLPDKDAQCHRTGFEKGCRSLVADGACRRWRKVNGTPAGETAPRDIYDCIDNHAHTLMLHLLASSDGNQAATESFRNAMVDIGTARSRALQDAQPRLIEVKNAN